MAALLSCTPTILSTPFANRTTTHFPLRPHSHTFPPSTKRFLRGSLSVARFGFQPGFLPQPDDTEFVIRELYNRAEGFLYTIADAAVLSSDTVVNTAIASSEQNNDWFSLITNYVETVLKILKYGLSTLHVPYAYGFAIIMLAVLLKAAIFPLARKKVEYDMAMQSLQLNLEAILKQDAGDQDTIVLETIPLYESSSIDPLLGCLLVLLKIPVWIGLYQAFSKMVDGGHLSEGFFWIPSLSGPTTIAAQQNGNGISWLFPFVDGHPLLGWPDTLAYLVLPVLLVVFQYISLQIIPSSEGPLAYFRRGLSLYAIVARGEEEDSSFSTSLTFGRKDTDPNVKISQEAFDVNFQDTDPNVESSKVLDNVLMSLVIGCFALLVPSGLSLYWFTDNVLNTLQQIWLRKLGGATIPETSSR
ncbi:unnamed protein product [Trifolium pratense]|uniref:Uncharacterized protein n=1 Tax=Trifolium pratense TaxID=57577 RepID=A0ACB0LGY9_TRIPR|nr:unnamed protein product [Trifolium pratense]